MSFRDAFYEVEALPVRGADRRSGDGVWRDGEVFDTERRAWTPRYGAGYARRRWSWPAPKTRAARAGRQDG